MNPLAAPPWFRPGPPATTIHRLAWPNRTPLFRIPLSQPVNMTPDINTRQDGVNTFLRNLNGDYGGNALINPNHPAPRRATWGPRVHLQETSTRDTAARGNVFYHYPDPAHPARRMAGVQNQLPAGMQPMALADYQGTVGQAAAALRLHQGTLYLVASREAPSQLREDIAWRRFLASLPANAQPPTHAAWAANHAPLTNSDLWHNLGVFVQSRADYPRQRAAYGDGTRPHHLQYAFDRTYRRCFIYDPSFVHETRGGPVGPGGVIPPGPATLAFNANQYHRLQNFLYTRTVWELLFGPGVGLARSGPGGRANWLRQLPFAPGVAPALQSVIFIGGGGNLPGLDECRRMTCVWMQQVAWLSRQLSRAIHAFQQHQTAVTEQAYLDAEHEWEQFFADYRPVRH